MTTTPSTGAASRADAAVDTVCLRLAFPALVPRAIATTATAVAVAWVLSFEVPWARLVPWVAVIAAINAARVVISRSYHRRPRTDDEVRAYAPAFFATGALAATAWGALIAVSGFSTSPLVVTTILLAIGGMMAAGAHTTSTPNVIRSSIVLSLTPIAVHMLVAGDPVLRVYLVPVAGHVLSTLSAVNMNYREVRESIALRFENSALVARLEQESARELAARRAAERADREKSRFLAAASHDVRQPLHALGLFVDALQARPLDADTRRLVSSIELAHASLASLHEGLLDVSRLDAGAIVASPSIVRVEDLVSRLEAESAPRAKERGLSFRIVARPEALFTDGELLLRLLRNLVSNAIAYTKRGGVLVALRRRGGRALVQVWDTGVGIPEHEHERVFDELHQVGNRARDREQGLGLGLAIVRRVAHLLGTDVQLRSRVGHGSVFELEVPLADAADAARAIVPVERAPNEIRAAQLGDAGGGAQPPVCDGSWAPTGAVALAVDDDPLARLALTETLTRFGYEVVVADNAEEALAYVQELDRLDVVVSDLWLPGRSGLALSEELAERRGLARVVVSGDTDPEAEAKVRASGAGFARKPVRAVELRRAIEASRPSRHEGGSAPATPPAL